MVEIERPELIAEKIVVSRTKPFVVVGIPAFNEEAMIARIVLNAQKYADAVLVCDDGSSDLTAEIAERLGADVIRHERNSGYGAALNSLFRRAREFDADVLVTLDADGQHDPAEIPDVLKPLVEGEADVVIGSRFIDGSGAKEMPVYRRFGAKLITKMVNGSSKNGVTDAQSGFRAYNREALDCITDFGVGMGASVEILLSASKNDLKICEVPSSCKYSNGEIDTSTMHPVKQGVGVVMSIVRTIVEEKPLAVLGFPALMFLFAGVGFGVWTLHLYALEHYVVTYLALASTAFLLIGFFLMSTATTLYAIARIGKKISGK